MTLSPGYSRAQIALHWLTAIGVLTAWFTHEAMEEIARSIWRAGGTPVPTVHTISGFLVLVMVLARLWLRRRHGAPAPEGSDTMRAAAVWGHRALYALLIAVPLAGILSWFGGIRDLGEVHGVLGNALLLVALGHAAVALWHHYGRKDGTLMRMLRPAPRA